MDKISNFAKKVDWIAIFFQGLTFFLGVFFLFDLAISLMKLGCGEDFYEPIYLTVDLISVKFHFVDECIPNVQVMNIYLIGWMLIGSWGMWLRFYEVITIRRIIKPMKEKSPFDGSVAKNIRKLSWIILIGEGVDACAEYAIRVWEYHNFNYEEIFISDKLVSISTDYNLNISFIWMFLIVYLLSYAFQYGQELQIQSDETL